MAAAPIANDAATSAIAVLLNMASLLISRMVCVRNFGMMQRTSSERGVGVQIGKSNQASAFLATGLALAKWRRSGRFCAPASPGLRKVAKAYIPRHCFDNHPPD